MVVFPWPGADRASCERREPMRVEFLYGGQLDSLTPQLEIIPIKTGTETPPRKKYLRGRFVPVSTL